MKVRYSVRGDGGSAYIPSGEVLSFLPTSCNGTCGGTCGECQAKGKTA